jgi:sulfur relay (sulfurtransferase) complex TusBCD TusD component (DsrE family)
MKLLNLVAPLFVISTTAFGMPAIAGEKDSLFVNMTADHPHRSTMAIQFSKSQFERGHPVTIFLNDKGVLVGSKANARIYKEQQSALAQIIKQGGVVIVCPMCMKKYGVKESDLIDGAKIGTPELTGSALFKDNTQTLSW